MKSFTWVTRHSTTALVVLLLAAAAPAEPGEDGRFDEALRNGKLARESLRASHAFLLRWMDRKDDRTALIRGGQRKDRWTVRETATRLYPQLVLAAHMTESGGAGYGLEQMLRREATLTARLMRLPDDFNLASGRFLYARSDAERIVNASAEYAAEGLSAIAGTTGSGPWMDRIQAIVDDIFSRASLKTPFASGPLPSGRAEVNGNLLRVLPLLADATGDPGYLDLARRLGDAYCLGVLPANGGIPASEWDFTAGKARNAGLSLNGAGYPIVEGLTLLCAIEAAQASPRGSDYAPVVARMLDALLDKARSPEGLFYARIEPDGRGGYAVDRKNRSSAWPRLLAACFLFGQISGEPRFERPALEILEDLPSIHARIWRNRPEILARDAPGILRLLTRAQTKAHAPDRPRLQRTLDWLDRESGRIQDALANPPGSPKESHDALFAQAALSHAWYKSAGLRLIPWRRDLVAGAAVAGDTLYVALQAEAPWQGTLHFDSARLRNREAFVPADAFDHGLPARFALAPDEDYAIRISGAGGSAIWSGAVLGQGLRVSIAPQNDHRVRIAKLPHRDPQPVLDSPEDSSASDGTRGLF